MLASRDDTMVMVDKEEECNNLSSHMTNRTTFLDLVSYQFPVDGWFALKESFNVPHLNYSSILNSMITPCSMADTTSISAARLWELKWHHLIITFLCTD
jgi:hypothetical protein